MTAVTRDGGTLESPSERGEEKSKQRHQGHEPQNVAEDRQEGRFPGIVVVGRGIRGTHGAVPRSRVVNGGLMDPLGREPALGVHGGLAALAGG